MNIKEILFLLYGEKKLLRLENIEPDGTRIIVEIPHKIKVEM